MTKKFLIAAVAIGFAAVSHAQIKAGSVLQKGRDAISGSNSSSNGLTKDEVVAGLKEALTRGAEISSRAAAAADGFNGNSLIRIPFPPEAENMKQRLIKLGMEKKVEEFEVSVNRAAEEASKEAAAIFVEAVRNMSVADGFAILNGGDTAATHFLRESTSASLTAKFTPIIKAAMEKVQVTAYWNPLVTTYNKIPGATKQNPDLEKYVTSRAIDGLMKLIAQEEKKIRQNPAAQASELLRKVFGAK